MIGQKIIVAMSSNQPAISRINYRSVKTSLPVFFLNKLSNGDAP